MNTKPLGAVIVGYGYMGEIRRRVVAADPAYRLVGIADPKPRPADEKDLRNSRTGLELTTAHR